MINEHHILHSKLEWRARKEARDLRELPSLKPYMDRAVHKALHENCPPVPLLGYFALVRINRDFYPQRDTLASVDDLLFTIQESSNHPKTHDIERRLAMLAVHAIELQRPFIREGIVSRG